MVIMTPARPRPHADMGCTSRRVIRQQHTHPWSGAEQGGHAPSGASGGVATLPMLPYNLSQRKRQPVAGQRQNSFGHYIYAGRCTTMRTNAACAELSSCDRKSKTVIASPWPLSTSIVNNSASSSAAAAAAASSEHIVTGVVIIAIITTLTCFSSQSQQATLRASSYPASAALPPEPLKLKSRGPSSGRERPVRGGSASATPPR
jgi:hypothetical protein